MASDFIAAAIAALFVTQSPMDAVVGARPDSACVATAPRMQTSDAPLGMDRVAFAPLSNTLGCNAPPSAAALALDIVRGWIARADASAFLDKLATQPRIAVWIVPLRDAVEEDPLHKLAREVIAELKQRNPVVSINRTQLLCLERALYFEARGEGALGQAAVAHVALNRVGTRPSRATVCDVVREPGQFAPYLTGVPDEAELAQTDEDATRIAMDTAARVMAGDIPDPSRGGLFFYAPRVLKTQPFWAKGMKETARVGGHRFFAVRLVHNQS
ncbi:MAG TPA: cell wall hydrolase [Candidatus Sulfotelmatobacter sp.]|nr:cell wall hydrolase [Candidatus Sulfotelmatobacter sp.]